MHKEDQK